MGKIFSFINESITADGIGRKTGYRVTGVNINDVEGIINLSWVKVKVLPDGSEDYIIDQNTHQVTDNTLMTELDADGNPVTETYMKDTIGDITDPDTGVVTQGVIGQEQDTRIKKTGAYSQWIKILKHEIDNVSPVMLIQGFIMEVEAQ
jgi:hypothetical protein